MRLPKRLKPHFKKLVNSSEITHTYEKTTIRVKSHSSKSIIAKGVNPITGLEYTLSPYSSIKEGSKKLNQTNSYWNAGNNTNLTPRANAVELLEKKLQSKSWSATPIILNGNIDCYNPMEADEKLTRRLLEVFLKYKHPVGIVTKSSMILRDLDLITELNKYGLISITISISTLNNELNAALEPGTDSPKRRMQVIKTLSSRNIPVSVITAPIIPGLNDVNIFKMVKIAVEYGATSIHPIVSVLKNDEVSHFKIWAKRNFPYRWRKILRRVGNIHTVNSTSATIISDYRTKLSTSIYSQFDIAFKTYKFTNRAFEYNKSLFNKTTSPQMSLFHI